MSGELALQAELPPLARLEELAQLALDEARNGGACGAAVHLGSSQGLSLTVRNGQTESVEFQRDNDLGITVYDDRGAAGLATGHASTADLDPASIRTVARAALSIARQTEADPHAGLPERERLATEARDLDLDQPVEIDIDSARDIALRCEAAALAHDARITNSDGATLSASRGVDLLANSLGFCGHRTATECNLSAVVIGGSGADMQRDYWYDRGRGAAVFAEAERIGRIAAERTVQRLGARKIAPAKVPILFPPEHARGLLGHLLAAASGGALYRRTSFLLDRLGERVASPLLDLRQDPFIPGAFGAGWFDDEGVATTRRTLVADGELQGYLLGSYSARKLGLQSTGNAGGARTLIARASGGDQASLMRQAGRGLLVTELMGHTVNLSTGDYSRGASGIWFEDGVPAYPVQELTIAGNLLDAYANLIAIGEDSDERGLLRCGSILLEGLTIAG